MIAATNDRKLNDEIHRICRQEGVYVNVASDREQCDFYFPGIYMEEGLVVGITASGLDHKKSAQDKRRDPECPGEGCAGR